MGRVFSPVLPLLGVIVIIGLVAGVLLFTWLTPPASVSPCTSIDREAYGIPLAVFSELPPLPSCFATIVHAYRAGRISDENFIDRSYFLQPEFFPGFEENGLSQWVMPSTTHYGAVGYASYPSSLRLPVQRGSRVSFRFFVRAGYGVRSYQGMRVSSSLNVLPEKSSTVQVVLDENATEGFVMGPTFPKFESSWVKEVWAHVTLAPDAPVGEITLSFSSGSPTRDVSLEVPSGRPYQDATYLLGSQPLLEVVLVST